LDPTPLFAAPAAQAGAQRHPVETDRAGGDGLQPDHGTDQRGLAGAGGTDNPGRRTGRDGEGDAVQSRDVRATAEDDPEVSSINERPAPNSPVTSAVSVDGTPADI